MAFNEDDNDVEMRDAWEDEVEMAGIDTKTIDPKVLQDDDEEWPSELGDDDNLEHNVNDYLLEGKGKQRAIAEYGESQASGDGQEIERLNAVAQEQADHLEAQAQQIEAQEKRIEGLKEAMAAQAKSLEQAERQLAEERQHTKRLHEQLFQGPRSRQKAIRSNVRTERRLGRPARPDRKHERELEKQAERFRNSRAENDAKLAKVTAKALEEGRRSQEDIALLKEDLEASKSREKELEKEGMGLFRTTEVLQAMLDKRDEDCKKLSSQTTRLTRAKEAAEARAERLANRGPQNETKDPEADVDGRLEVQKRSEENAQEGAEGEKEWDALLEVPETVNTGPFPGWKKWVVSLSVGFLFGLLVASSVVSGSS